MHSTELKARRRALGLTQEELARRLDVATATVARWEQGAIQIEHGQMLRFALRGIEDDLREEWEALPAEEKHRRTQAKMAEGLREADEREAAHSPAGGHVHRQGEPGWTTTTSEFKSPVSAT